MEREREREWIGGLEKKKNKEKGETEKNHSIGITWNNRIQDLL